MITRIHPQSVTPVIFKTKTRFEIGQVGSMDQVLQSISDMLCVIQHCHQIYYTDSEGEN